jgi:hypothetical protein
MTRFDIANEEEEVFRVSSILNIFENQQLLMVCGNDGARGEIFFVIR